MDKKKKQWSYADPIPQEADPAESVKKTYLVHCVVYGSRFTLNALVANALGASSGGLTMILHLLIGIRSGWGQGVLRNINPI